MTLDRAGKSHNIHSSCLWKRCKIQAGKYIMAFKTFTPPATRHVSHNMQTCGFFPALVKVLKLVAPLLIMSYHYHQGQ